MTAFSFDRIIAPCDPATFLSQYWEAKPLHLARKDAEYYSALFSSVELEAVLQYVRPQPPDLRVVLEQVELPASKYVNADGSLNMNQLYKAYGEGHTMVVNSLQRFVPKLALLCRQLQELTNFPVEFNVYLTPASAHGLHPHYDTHDVFVLQIEGKKTWSLYGSAQECPLLGTFQPVIPVAILPTLERVVELEAGDLLYLPRGHIHDAETSNEHSMHITIGIYPTQWVDLLSTALTNLSLKDVRFRKAVPFGYLNDDSARPQMDLQLQQLIEAFADSSAVELLYESQTDQLIRKALPLADGHFASIDAASKTLNLKSRMLKRPNMRCRVTEEGNEVRIHFPGNTIKAGVDYRDAFLFVATSDAAFEVNALPDSLDPGRKIILVQRLIRGGLLQLVGSVKKL
jgi:ribosomal protein L16 Arg81 hydroxylase